MRFWVFDPPMMVGRWAFAEVVDAVYGRAPRCERCGQLIGMRPWLPPYKAKLSPGTKRAEPADVITGPGFTGFMATLKFVEGFRQAELRGIDRWEPVELGGLAPGSYLYGVMPAPSVRASLSKMHAVFDGGPPTCPRCRQAVLKSYSGVVVDEGSWTGQDIFQLTNPSILLTTGRFADFAAAGEYTGLHLIPAEKYVPSYLRPKIG
jgi:hypothetical protein